MESGLVCRWCSCSSLPDEDHEVRIHQAKRSSATRRLHGYASRSCLVHCCRVLVDSRSVLIRCGSILIDSGRVLVSRYCVLVNCCSILIGCSSVLVNGSSVLVDSRRSLIDSCSVTYPTTKRRSSRG